MSTNQEGARCASGGTIINAINPNGKLEILVAGQQATKLLGQVIIVCTNCLTTAGTVVRPPECDQESAHPPQ